MSAMKNKLDQFLDYGGWDLGYDDNNLPKLEDMDYVLDHDITVWEYHGMSKREFYGG